MELVDFSLRSGRDVYLMTDAGLSSDRSEDDQGAAQGTSGQPPLHLLEDGRRQAQAYLQAR